MTMLSLRLSQTLAQGRARPPRAQDRADLLNLLHKRAAYKCGADELEGMLRDQIRWALPMVRIQPAPGD